MISYLPTTVPLSRRCEFIRTQVYLIYAQRVRMNYAAHPYALPLRGLREKIFHKFFHTYKKH